MTVTVQLLSAAEVAGAYRLSVGHVHLLAHRHKWRRIRHGGRVYYALADVDRVLGRD